MFGLNPAKRGKLSGLFSRPRQSNTRRNTPAIRRMPTRNILPNGNSNISVVSVELGQHYPVCLLSDAATATPREREREAKFFDQFTSRVDFHFETRRNGATPLMQRGDMASRNCFHRKGKEEIYKLLRGCKFCKKLCALRGYSLVSQTATLQLNIPQ